MMNSGAPLLACRWRVLLVCACVVLLVCACVVLLAASLKAQGDDFTYSHKRFAKKFTYQTFGKEEVLKTWFHYMVSKTEKDSIIVRVFYPETGQITSLITFTDRWFRERSGLFKEWYDNGQIMTEGQYESGRRAGRWKEYAPQGSYAEGGYERGMKEGEWREGVDTAGNYARLYTYKMGRRHGLFVTNDSLGVDTGWYEQGKLTKPARVGGPGPVEHTEVFPSFGPCPGTTGADEMDTCTTRTFMKFIGRTVKYPNEAVDYSVQGKAVIEFTVDKDGYVMDVTVRRGLCRAIEEECVRVMKKSPRWNPGTQDGKPVKVRFTQPIKFTLK